MQGKLYIKPLQAELLHNTEGIFGKMDPYIVFGLGDQKFKTGVCKNGGKTPFWNDIITLIKYPSDNILFIEIWDDENAKKDKYIASAQVDLLPLITQGHTLPWINLSFELKNAGKLLLDITFEPELVQMQHQMGIGQPILGQPILGQPLLGQPKFDYSKGPQQNYPGTQFQQFPGGQNF